MRRRCVQHTHTEAARMCVISGVVVGAECGHVLRHTPRRASSFAHKRTILSDGRPDTAIHFIASQFII